MAESSSSSNNQTRYQLREIEFKDIKIIQRVGRGSFGTVSQAEWNNKAVAVKEFDAFPDNNDSIETEIKQLSKVTHPNIIALYGISSNNSFICLIMEYAEGGSLYNFLHGSNQPKYEVSHALSWSRQCAEGVAYMHLLPQPLMHRDLKTPNLLLFDAGRRLKICDFGTVANKKAEMTNNKGSAIWMAPEVFSTTVYNEKCDVFSWGIILWEVLSGQIPFSKEENAQSISWKVYHGTRPERIHGCPKPINDLMESSWEEKPKNRPSMPEVVKIMNQICACFPGADIPIDSNSRRIYETIEKDNNLINNDVLSKISEQSHDNGQSTLINSILRRPAKTSTQTNQNTTTYRIFNSSLDPQIQLLNSMASKLNICNTIPEETELSLSTNSNQYKGNMVNMNYLPTAMSSGESAERNQNIRNGMLKSQTVALPSLLVEVDPNSWEKDYEAIMRSICEY